MLPTTMDSYAARALMLAIGQQESRFLYRRQINGPARGFWQFEVNGVRGVLNHQSTKRYAAAVLTEMRIQAEPEPVHAALEYSDILAAVMARLLLWTYPRGLPNSNDALGGWEYYIACWRPGKPHRATWDAFYEAAWGSVG